MLWDLSGSINLRSSSVIPRNLLGQKVKRLGNKSS